MGIRLDWEIESERKSLRGAGEDQTMRRDRRGRYVQLLLTGAFAVMLVAAVAIFITYRNQRFNFEIERDLRDTVQSEIASIRIGDWNGFQRIQRSDDEGWIRAQEVLFDDYMELFRRNENVQLSGTILNMEVADPRARVQVLEIIDGVPYTRLWFYYRYVENLDNEPGADSWSWYHTPQDPTFWGDPAQIDRTFLTVTYQTVDSEFAKAVADQLQSWLEMACNARLCPADLKLRVDIVPHGVAYMGWSAEDPWLLEMRSPLADRMRSDQPFDPERRVATASLLAEKLVSSSHSVSVVAGSDVDFLLSGAITPWLVGRFISVNTESFLIDSLANTYGIETVGQVVAALGSDSDIAVISDVLGQPLDQLSLDWRDYLTWLLNHEQELIAANDLDGVTALYDTSDDTAIQRAFRRMSEPLHPSPLTVTFVQSAGVSEDGRPQLLATVRVGEGETMTEFTALFRLQNGVWKRVE